MRSRSLWVKNLESGDMQYTSWYKGENFDTPIASHTSLEECIYQAEEWTEGKVPFVVTDFHGQVAYDSSTKQVYGGLL